MRFNEETRPTDAYDGDTDHGVRLRHDRCRVRGPHATGGRCAHRELRSDGDDAGSVRALPDPGPGRRTRTRTCFRRSTSCRVSATNSNIRLSYSTTVNRPEFRELAEFEFTDVVGNRAVKGNSDLKRALIQNVDARWEMFSGWPQRPRRERVLQAFRPADRARRHCGGESDRDVPERRYGQELRPRAGGGAPVRHPLLLQRQLHVRRFEDHAGARAAGGPDVVRAPACGAIEEPVQPRRRILRRRLLDAAAVQLLR